MNRPPSPVEGQPCIAATLAARAATSATQTTASIDSRDLFVHGKTLLIEHSGQRYTLRVTRENKLILTK